MNKHVIIVCVCVCVLVPLFPLPFLEPVASVHQLAVTKQRDKEWTQPQIIKHHSRLHTPVLLLGPCTQLPEVSVLQELQKEWRCWAQLLTVQIECVYMLCFATKMQLVSQRTWVKSWGLSDERWCYSRCYFITDTKNPMSRVLNRAHSPSLAAVTSLVSLAITLQAASCW